MTIPTINLSLIPTFPARVVGAGPIKVTKAGLTHTFKWDIAQFSLNPSPLLSQIQFLGYNPATLATELYNFSSIIPALQITSAQISDSTSTGRAILTGDDSAGRTALGLGAAAILNVGSGLTADTGTIRVADMATARIKGRTSPSTGLPEDLTGAQATALLNAFGGDSGSGGVKGLVPAPAAGDAPKYLAGDGTWKAFANMVTTGFDTITSATAATIGSTVQALTVFGYSALGDSPPARYVKVGSQPSHPGKFQSADGAWWEFADSFCYPEHLGAVGSGSVNDRTAVNNWLSLLMAKKVIGRVLTGKTYRCDSALQDITRTISVDGLAGIAPAAFIRNFTGTAGKGFFHFTADAGGTSNNSTLRSISLQAASGTTLGALLAIVSTSTVAVSGIVLQDLWLTTNGTDTHTNTLVIDGTAKTTAPIGVRDTEFRNVHVFGATSASVLLNGAAGLTWYGGGVYPAGGSAAASGSITITGTASVNSVNVRMDITGCNGLNLTRMSGVNNLACGNIGAVSGVSINNDSTCTATCVHGTVTGTVVANWVNSGIRRPGAAFATS